MNGENKEDPREERAGLEEGHAEHRDRVHEAFDALHEELGDRVSGDAKEAMEKLRDAAARRDGESARERLSEVRGQYGWLYAEMTKHPQLAALIDELALWGF